MCSSGGIVVRTNLRFLLFQSHFFSKVNIPASGILTIDSSLPVKDCAEDYERKLKEVKPSEINGFSAEKRKFTHVFKSKIIEEWVKFP